MVDAEDSDLLHKTARAFWLQDYLNSDDKPPPSCDTSTIPGPICGAAKCAARVRETPFECVQRYVLKSLFGIVVQLRIMECLIQTKPLFLGNHHSGRMCQHCLVIIAISITMDVSQVFSR